MKNKILLYILIFCAGYTLGYLNASRHSQAPVYTPAPKSVPPASLQPESEPQFQTMTEMELYRLNSRLERLKYNFVSERNSPAESEKLLKEVDELSSRALELAYANGTEFQLGRQLQERSWYCIAKGDAVQAKIYLEEALEANHNHRGYSRSRFAHFYQQFGLHEEAVEQMRLAVSEEPELLFQYERRVKLGRYMLEADLIEEAEEELKSLQDELEAATQKKSIVGILADLWSVREEIAIAKNDSVAADFAKRERKRYLSAYYQLR